MRIGINTLSLPPGFYGDTVFFRNIFARLREMNSATHGIFLTSPKNHDFFDGYEREYFAEIKQCKPGRFPIPEKELEKTLHRGGINCLLTPLNHVPQKLNMPIVLLAQDLCLVSYFLAKPTWRNRRLLKSITQTCARAASIIAPSKYIQRQLFDLLDVPLDKIVVAPMGVSDVFEQPQVPWVDGPYILCVGSTRFGKNVEMMIKVFGALKEKIPHSLVVVGQPGNREPENWGDRVIRIERCPDYALAALYQHCDAFVHPAVYEGSAIAVLEAMRAGAEIIAGKTGAIPELAGNAPRYCDTKSAHSIAAAIMATIKMPSEERKKTR